MSEVIEESKRRFAETLQTAEDELYRGLKASIMAEPEDMRWMFATGMAKVYAAVAKRLLFEFKPKAKGGQRDEKQNVLVGGSNGGGVSGGGSV